MRVMCEKTGQELVGEKALTQSIKRVLRTRLGTKEMFREFGSKIHHYLDGSANNINLHIGHEVITDLEKWLPGLKVTDVLFDKEHRQDGEIRVEIRGEYNSKEIISSVRFASN